MKNIRYYIISYDLKEADPAEYLNLKKTLKSKGAKHIQSSIWIFRAQKSTSTSILNYLKSKELIACEDSLFVARIDENDFIYKESKSTDSDFTFDPDMFED